MIKVAIAITSMSGPPRVFCPIFELIRRDTVPTWKFTGKYNDDSYIWFTDSNKTFPHIEAAIEEADMVGIPLLDGRELDHENDHTFIPYNLINFDKLLNGVKP